MERTFVNSQLNTKLCAHLRAFQEITSGEQRRALEAAENVIRTIAEYTLEHDLALSCGGEWLYQSDRGQIDALELVANLLDDLSEFDDHVQEEWE